jgi:Protein of unknown function (DUF3626)
VIPHGAAACFAPAIGHTISYVEAQVHGIVRLAEDGEALVIDPAFADTPTGEQLLAGAERYGFAAEWHPGLALPPSQVPHDVPETAGPDPMRWQAFCAGGRARRLAEQVVADHGATPRLDAASIGRAAARLVRDPESWRDWGTPPEMRDHLKDLWVIVVVHGVPPR